MTAISSAQILRDTFTRRGIVSAEHQLRYLGDLYSKLRVVHDRADFAAVEPLVAHLPQGGQWGTRPFAVIVETRAIPELAYVIENIAEHTQLSIQIIHGQTNRGIMNSAIVQRLQSEGKCLSIELPTETLSPSTYNALFLDQRFYRALGGQGQCLVFQTDSLCCKGSAFTLHDFLDFDYVGAVWPLERPIGLRINGGCGGFSLRNCAASVAALNRFPAGLWPGGEDGYFAFHLDLMGYKVADATVMAQFATQSVYRFRSFGAHQVRNLPITEHALFLEYCPEIRNVLSWDYSPSIAATPIIPAKQ